MSIATVVLVALVIILVGTLPTWSHSARWGYAPSGVIGLAVAVVVVLLMAEQI